MPGPAFTSNHRRAWISAQNLINPRNALTGVACSHMHARYPQSLPQFPGASGNAQSRATQGFAPQKQSFSLDPDLPIMPGKAFCTTGRLRR